MAGLSLGEYTALHAAGVFSGEDLIRITAFRGKEMTKAGSGLDTKMIAVMGLSEEESTYDRVEVDDPIGGPVTGDYKASYQYYFVLRGAAWNNSSGWLTFTNRQNNPDNCKAGTRGTRFTVVCE